MVEMTDDEIRIMSIWTHEIGQIELVEIELKRFCLNHLTDSGCVVNKLASASHPHSSRMLKLFHGVDSRNFSEAEVWRMLRKLKMERDESVILMNSWMNDNASEHGAVSSILEDSIECMVETWSRDVIGRYERIAQAYMAELDSPTHANSNTSSIIFIDAAKMSRTFECHFPQLAAWNSNESVVYRASHGKIAWISAEVSPQPAIHTGTDDVVMTENTTLMSAADVGKDDDDDDDDADERGAKRARTSRDF